MVKRGLAVGLAAVLLWPALLFAQTSKAGVVTVLEGNVTARRGAPPAQVPLKFKDDVFLQDTVATGDKSLARMLLGGKALVTVRERSVLTITEVPGRSTIEIESGKFALALAREKMRPGEEIQIRTPNAVAGVRGTVVVTEVQRQGAQVGAGLPAVLTSFFVLRGALVAQPLDAAKQPVGAPLQVGILQSYTGAGLATPRVQPIPPEQIGAVIAGLQPTGPKRGSDTAQDDVKAQGVQTAIVLLAALTGDQASFLAGLPSGLRLPPTLLSTVGNVDTRVINPFFQLPEVLHVDAELSPVDSSVTPAGASLCPGCVRLSRVTVNVTGAPFQAFSGSFASTSPEAFLGFDTSILTHSGSSSFVQVPAGSAVSFGGPLAALLDTSITTSGTFLEIANSQLTNTSTSPLVTLDPSSIDAGDALVALNGATLATGGPLLTDTGGTVSSHQEFLRMVDSTLTSTAINALVTLSGTTLGAQTLFGLIGSIMALAGPDVDGTGSASLLAATDSHLDLAGDALFVANGSGLSSTSLAPLVSLTNTNVSALGTFLEVLASSVTLDGSLLRATNLSSIATGFPFIDIGPGGSLTTTGTVNPLVDLDTASLTAGGAFLQTNGTGTAATVNMSGPLLRSVASTLALTDISPTSLAVTNPSTRRANVAVGDGTGAPNGLAVTPDGTRVYVANGGRDLFTDYTLTIVSTATNTVVGSIDLSSNDPPIGIAFNPTGTRGYATAAFSDVISVIDTDPASPTFNTILTNVTIPGASFARFAVVTGGRVYITDQSADKVHVITDSASPVFVQSISVGVKPFGIAVSPDGSKVYVTNRGISGSGSVSVISTASNTVIGTIGLGASTNPAGIVVTPNGAKLYVANTGTGQVAVINAATNTVAGTIAVSAEPRGIAITPDGTRVLVATGSLNVALATLTVINTATDAAIATIGLDHGGAPAFVAVSPDGRRVYVTEENALNLAVLDLETGTAFVAIGAGSSVTAAGSAPFIDMTGSTLTADHLLLLEGTLTLQHSLLRATNSTLTIPKALVRILPGGALITQPNAAGPYPLVLLSGGSLNVGTDVLAGSIFDIAGRTVVSGLGTDQPIQHGGGGSLLEMTNGASVEVEGPGESSVVDTRNLGNVLTIDTALLNATAPVLKMSGQSYLESYGNVIDLASRANLQTSLGTDLIRIDQSRLDIVKGHLVSMTHGLGESRLGVGGNLLTMVGTAASPSTLNVFNGTLLFAKDGAQANIAGSLVQFIGTSAGSNVINVTNSFSPNSFINGVPVHSTFGTTVTITGTPLANLGTQGTIKVNGTNLPAGATGGVTGSLVVVQGSGTTVKIGP
jgi:YVTN family beta-propeller protein